MGKFGNLVYFLVLIAAGGVVYAAFFDRNPAPQVTFVSLKGEKIPIESLRGKVVLVNFWATDCTICIKEMPHLVATYNKYRARGFETIAVAMKYDPPNYVISYSEKNALPFKVALDSMGELAKAFGDVKRTPTSFIIDKRGMLVSRLLGEPDFAKLEDLLEKKLADGA